MGCTRSHRENEPYSYWKHCKVMDKVFAVDKLKRNEEVPEEKIGGSEEEKNIQKKEDEKMYDLIDVDLTELFEKGWELWNKETKETSKSHSKKKGSTSDDIPKVVRFGHLVVFVEPTRNAIFKQHRSKYHYPYITSWVTNTMLGVDMVTIRGNDHMVLSTDLMTGKPVDGIQLKSLYAVSGKNDFKIGSIPQAETATGGLAIWQNNTDIDQGTVKINKETDDYDIIHLIVVEGINGDSLILPYFAETIVSSSSIWHVFDSRKLYRPTEEVSIKGWLRLLTESDSDTSNRDGGWYDWEKFAKRLKVPDVSSKKSKKTADKWRKKTRNTRPC